MKIAIAGVGCVGLSNAILLAKHNTVIAVNISPERVAQLNNQQAPISDPEIEQPLILSATTEATEAYATADYVLVATPKNYDPATNYFDTSSVEAVIDQVIAVNPSATIVVKSTVPVGFTARINDEKNTT